MKRIDYREPSLGAHLHAARRPGAVLLVAAVAMAGVHGVEAARASALGRSVAGAAAEVAAAERGVGGLRALERERDRLRAVLAHRERSRASGEARARELAALGDAIPAGTWLASLRVDDRGYALDARARSLADVAPAIVALERVATIAAVRLVEARDAGRDGVSYGLMVERRK